ncbi:hypothetical protein Hypma_009462 [Hypsizygus marmoreus]|uniref:F-box domain-containing protein n=1 Tax=Hypsizygus marmoreus TaxID=39966 RepID=A0A369JNB9_HYPMA|nr:hypothetical protein Hypma_009462 [Hypsizygus marmoreus]
MSFPRGEPILPADVLSMIYGSCGLSLHDGLALSSVTRVTRLVSLPFFFSRVRLTKTSESALEHADQALFSAVRKISTGLTASTKPGPAYFTVMLRLLPKFPNLYGLYLNPTFLPLSLLPAFLLSIKSLVSLRKLQLCLDTESAPDLAGDEPPAGPPNLKMLFIIWGCWESKAITPDPITDASGFLRALIEPSVSTLQDLRITFEYEQSKTMSFDFGVLKGARALRSFSLESYGDNADLIDEVLAGVLSPTVNALSLVWLSYPGKQPVFKESFVASLAHLPNLATLTLGLDFEKDAKDTLCYDHDFEWYIRCLLRRLRATELLAAACPALETVVWQQTRIDSEGNDMYHAFRVKDDSGGRAVKIVKDWWMQDRYKDRWGGPLPDNIDDAPLDLMAISQCYGSF